MGGGARVSDFFTKNPNPNLKKIFFFLGGGEGGVGGWKVRVGLVKMNLFYFESQFKIKKNFGRGAGDGVGGGGRRRVGGKSK